MTEKLAVPGGDQCEPVISLAGGRFDFRVTIKNLVSQLRQNGPKPTEELRLPALVKIDLFDQVQRWAAQPQLQSLRQRLRNRRWWCVLMLVVVLNGVLSGSLVA